ncbi:MAG: entericidin A/B family lipoprotein [Phycisphaerales bacterium]
MQSKTTNLSRLRAVLIALGLVSFGFALQACNTTEGVGEDIRAAGDAIDHAAEDAND